MALNKTQIFVIPVLVFAIITFGIVFLAHVNRFIMQHRRYFPRCCIRQRLLAQRWKRRFNKIFLTVHSDFADNFGCVSVLRVIIQNSRGELSLKFNEDITVTGRFPFLVSLILRKGTWFFKWVENSSCLHLVLPEMWQYLRI